MIETYIPNSEPIKLSAYYEDFIEYYPNCEMQTKRWFVENAKPDWVFLDIGANIGYYSVLFSRLAPEGRVYAFEPTNTYDMLKQNLDSNNAFNVIPYKIAVGESDGTKTDRFFRIWGKEAETIECPFTTIDHFVEENKITKIDAIKIDTDSYDFEVLQGALNTIRRFDPFIVVKMNNEALSKRGFSSREVCQWLYKKAGYSITCVLGDENYLLKQSPDIKNITYHNVSLISNLLKQPYLSIVTVSRNDNHGGDPQRRTQIFIDSYAWQAEHYKLETELVLIDWNSPKDKPGLTDILSFPANEYFYARVITIPPEVHDGFRYSETFPLFQFIGKNVGIRRARGEFILATCIDSILDDRLFKYLACRRLRKNWLYRVDLYDVNNSIPNTGHYEQQDFCRNPEFEDLTRGKFQKYRALWEEDRIYVKDAFRYRADFPWLKFIDDEGVIIGKSKTKDLNNKNFENNGDFTLMHREAWHKLRGYGEFESFSMNIDSQLMAHAFFNGFSEANFIPPYVCYHIAHGFQKSEESDFITTTEHLKEIVKSNMPVFSWNIYDKRGIASFEKMVSMLQQNPHALLNDERWGLRDINLEEYIFDEENRKLQETKPKPVSFKPISAIKPEFYFERIAFESFRDIISTKESVIMEKDSLLGEKESAIREKDSLLGEKESVIREKDSLLGEKESVIREKDSLLGEKESVIREKDSLLEEKESVIREKDSLLGEKESVIREKDSLLEEKYALIIEKDNIISEKDAIIEILKIPSKADRVVEKLRQHHIIWFFTRGAYWVSVKLYKILKATKFFIKEVIKFLLPYVIVRFIQIRKENAYIRL